MALGGVPWGMEERDTAGREPRVSVDSVQAAPVHTPVASASDRGAHSHDSELQALRDQVALLRHHNWVLREQHARLWHHMSALERTRQQLQLQLQIEAAVFGLALPTPPDYSAVYWAAAQPTVMATPCNTAGWGTGVGLVGAGSPAAALAPCSGACVYSAAAATNGVYTAAGPPGASPSPSAPMDDTEGDLSEWEQHLVDVFVAKVTAGHVAVGGDLARRMREFVNPARPAAFYRRLVSHGPLGVVLGRHMWAVQQVGGGPPIPATPRARDGPESGAGDATGDSGGDVAM